MREVKSSLRSISLFTTWLIKICGILTLPIKHKGFYNLSKLFSLIPSKDEKILITLENDSVFEIVLKDPYWNRLLSNYYQYEPEIYFLFNYLKDIKFSFIDGGANWGFWSVIVSSRKFQAVETVAYEPIPKTFLRLKRNSELNNNRFKVVQKAISTESSNNIEMTIDDDAELSAVGASISKKSTRRSSSILVSADGIDQVLADLEFKDRVIIKLDLEGVESEVIQASKWIDQNDCLLIFEDHGKNPHCDVIQTVLAKNWPIFFIHDNGKIISINSKNQAALLKKKKSKGYNFFSAYPGGIFDKTLRSKVSPIYE